ncbi:MAG TPA: cupin domain-containing protein, partial [Steroidobacteraceae bacterium]|nr:cupin domain-containing protein [Steroidobacteraceae bacterium]
MKKQLSLLVFGCVLISLKASAQDAFAFFKGEAFPPARSTPAAWLHELHKADGLLNSNIAVAEFLPNTRLAWHNHPGGQILLITDGVGYYQEKGKPRQIVRKGDVIKCLPGMEHWHGASVESGVTYVATSPAQKGGTVWAQAVT